MSEASEQIAKHRSLTLEEARAKLLRSMPDAKRDQATITALYGALGDWLRSRQ